MADSPNIILINCDDLGYGDVGCYGSQLNSTPNLDRMAAEGMRFTDFYMAASVCSPSRAAMMTGSYPKRIGINHVLFPGNDIGLNPDEVCVAQILNDQGYATKIVGKWHCGDQPEFLPTRFGFDEYYGIPYSNDMGMQAGRRIDWAVPLPLLRDEEVIQEQPDQVGLTERYVEESVRFLRANSARPFFLYLAHMYVHLPIYVPDRFMRESKNGRYGGAVACVDWACGVLMHELRQLGIDDNTLMIFTSDNGSRNRDEGGSNRPLKGTKFSTWEGGFRLPCIMRWPAKIKSGTVCHDVATAMDFLPTFAGLASATAPTDRVIDGRNIAPLMLGEDGASSPHEAFFYYSGTTLCAVRAGKWKLHIRRFASWNEPMEEVQELYDLEADIGEETNVYAGHPDVVAELESLLEQARADLGDDASDVEGANVRLVGKVENAKPLTEWNPEHPYIIAEYDLADRG
jgi:arylsulfatase A-like enzyme